MTIKDIKKKSGKALSGFQKQFKGAKQRIADALARKSDIDDEEITRGTKIKVFAAIAVVGFATYIAYWVQEPIDGFDIQANVVAEDEAAIDDVVIDEVEIAAVSPDAIEVSIEDFTYSPANLTVNPGTEVVWTNKDPVPHTVTSTAFGSGTIGPGESFSYVFEADGTFEYDCSFHPQMKGKIIVGTGEASGETVEDLSPVEEFEEEMMPAADTDVSTELLTLDDEPELVTEDNVVIGDIERIDDDSEELPETVTIDAEDLLADEELAADTLELSPEQEAAHAAIAETDELAKSGPEDFLYAGLLIGVLYFNRKRFQRSLF